ncbi:hypothetical protein R1flu_022804 [Riccia fluitans]|uniref:Uncharacterized protein n=1 Tax=Riccia fluitans TaxID=41844 RepID=A0ABD1XQC2_9MARC
MAVKAKEMAIEIEQRTEAIRLEKNALQQQCTKEKAEWETKNTQLIEEVGQLHEEKKRIAAREEDVQKELAQIRSLMEQAVHNTGEAPKLKRELEAKQEELKRLQEAGQGFVITSVPSMRDFKNEALESLKGELALKS